MPPEFIQRSSGEASGEPNMLRTFTNIKETIMKSRHLALGLAFFFGITAGGWGGLASATDTGTLQKPANYPTRSSELTVPFGPGGRSEFFARTMAPGQAKKLRVPIAAGK